MAGMQVDYYGLALALGVGWQDWKKACILLLRNCSLEWHSLCCTILAVSAKGLVFLGFFCRFAPLCERMLIVSCFWRCLQVCGSGLKRGPKHVVVLHIVQHSTIILLCFYCQLYILYLVYNLKVFITFIIDLFHPQILYCTKIILQLIESQFYCLQLGRTRRTTINGERTQFFASPTVKQPDVQFHMCPSSQAKA